MTTAIEHVEHLSNVITTNNPTLKESQSYLDSTYRLSTLGLGAPPEMHYLRVNVGWPSLYLRAIEERLDVESFRISGKDEGVEELWKWWQANNLDEESSLGHMDSLTYGRSYITIAAPGKDDDTDSPIIRLESPLSMFAEIDPRTHKVTRAVRLYKTDPSSGLADSATLLLPNETIYLKRDSGATSAWVQDGPPTEHKLGMVPVVPLTNRSRLSNRYGESEITPEVRSITDAAARTLMNLQAASELMAVPLRVFLGVDRDELVGSGSTHEVNNAYYARIMALENDQAKAFEFGAADLRNFTEELGELAKHFASYTGLPPQYLTFSSDNPASAEAIQASESRLVKTCERKARMLGGSWESAMRIATKVMKKTVPADYRGLETVWSNPATPTYAAKVDAATKGYANGQGVLPKEQARIDIGYSVTQRENMKRWDEEENPMGLVNSLFGKGTPANPQPVKPAKAAVAA